MLTLHRIYLGDVVTKIFVFYNKFYILDLNVLFTSQSVFCMKKMNVILLWRHQKETVHFRFVKMNMWDVLYYDLLCAGVINCSVVSKQDGQSLPD